MKYRQLGKWGIHLSEIGFGSWLTLNKHGQDVADSLHHCAYEAGINFFDTANVYGRGHAEKLVGKSLKSYKRDTYVLATKVYFGFQEDWPFPKANDRGLSRKHIFEQCSASLKRLDTDYIDLYQCHRYDERTPLIETCHAMNDLINQVKVLYWGVSEWTADQINEAVQLCESNSWHIPVSNQPLYNMIESHWEDDVFPTCAKLGLGLVNFSPLAEGILTGKYSDGIPEDSRAADEEAGQFLRPRLTDETIEKLKKLMEIAASLEISMATLAIAWCLRREELTSCIIGASRPEQILENIKASDVNLDEKTLSKIHAILKEV